MATRPYKTTGCFRFALFLIILAPIVYLAASYYNGQDGIQNIKNIFQSAQDKVGINRSPKDNKTSEPSNPVENNSTSSDGKIEELNLIISTKDKEINALIDNNLDLKMKLKECENKAAAGQKIK